MEHIGKISHYKVAKVLSKYGPLVNDWKRFADLVGLDASTIQKVDDDSKNNYEGKFVGILANAECRSRINLLDIKKALRKMDYNGIADSLHFPGFHDDAFVGIQLQNRPTGSKLQNTSFVNSSLKPSGSRKNWTGSMETISGNYVPNQTKPNSSAYTEGSNPYKKPVATVGPQLRNTPPSRGPTNETPWMGVSSPPLPRTRSTISLPQTLHQPTFQNKHQPTFAVEITHTHWQVGTFWTKTGTSSVKWKKTPSNFFISKDCDVEFDPDGEFSITELLKSPQATYSITTPEGVREKRAEVLAAIFLSKVRKIVHRNDWEALFVVPITFLVPHRQALENACILAGFRKPKIMNDTTAAVLHLAESDPAYRNYEFIVGINHLTSKGFSAHFVKYAVLSDAEGNAEVKMRMHKFRSCFEVPLSTRKLKEGQLNALNMWLNGDKWENRIKPPNRQLLVFAGDWSEALGLLHQVQSLMPKARTANEDLSQAVLFGASRYAWNLKRYKNKIGDSSVQTLSINGKGTDLTVLGRSPGYKVEIELAPSGNSGTQIYQFHQKDSSHSEKYFGTLEVKHIGVPECVFVELYIDKGGVIRLDHVYKKIESVNVPYSLFEWQTATLDSKQFQEEKHFMSTLVK